MILHHCSVLHYSCNCSWLWCLSRCAEADVPVLCLHCSPTWANCRWALAPCGRRWWSRWCPNSARPWSSARCCQVRPHTVLFVQWPLRTCVLAYKPGADSPPPPPSPFPLTRWILKTSRDFAEVCWTFWVVFSYLKEIAVTTERRLVCFQASASCVLTTRWSSSSKGRSRWWWLASPCLLTTKRRLCWTHPTRWSAHGECPLWLLLLPDRLWRWRDKNYL